ncbi:MAG: hypothetical protein PUF29_04980 [Anaerobutyricum hallii]|uniref:hypothetical protein n=1 Tax=Anaerobutyricum hallii TaxID=39488 RepID=UPI0024319FD7|nr:hypothetical protein [Anaerobutyricum hallii]MDD6587962.1 hypothetical protein [Anaerobutyricum hallii]
MQLFELFKTMLNRILIYGIRPLLISILAGIIVIVFLIRYEIISDITIASLVGMGFAITIWLILSFIIDIYRSNNQRKYDKMKQERYHIENLLNFLQSLDPGAEKELEEIINNENKITPIYSDCTVVFRGKNVPDEFWEIVDLPQIETEKIFIHNGEEHQISTKKGRRLRKDIYDELKRIWPLWEKIKRENLFQ